MKRNDNMFHFKFKVANRKEEIIFDAWMGSKRTEVQWIDAKGCNYQRYINTSTAKELINDGVWVII